MVGRAMTKEDTSGVRLRLPVQAAPVDRTPRARAAAGGPGVEASQAPQSWADLLAHLNQPVAMDFAPPLFTF